MLLQEGRQLWQSCFVRKIRAGTTRGAERAPLYLYWIEAFLIG